MSEHDTPAEGTSHNPLGFITDALDDYNLPGLVWSIGCVNMGAAFGIIGINMPRSFSPSQGILVYSLIAVVLLSAAILMNWGNEVQES